MLKLSSIQWKMECKAWSNSKAYLLYSGRWNVKLGLMLKLSSIQWKMECKAWANAKAIFNMWKMECKAWANDKAIFYIVEDGM